MRILFVTNQMPPLVDGVGDYTCNLAREFARHGHEVAVVCRTDARIRTDYEDIKVFPVVRRWDFAAARPIVRLIRTLGTEVVSLQYVPYGFQRKGLCFPLVYLCGCIRKTGCSLFTFFHEVYIGYHGHNLIKICVSYLMGIIASYIMKESTWGATSIKHYANVLQSLSGLVKCIPLMPIPSNIPENELSCQELVYLRQKIARTNEFIVAFLGKRDVFWCLKAIERLLAKGKKIRILAVGKTNVPFVPDLESFMYRTGVLPIEELGKYLSISDCIVLPEGKSGCSFKSGSLMAALKAGKAVVTNKGFMTDDSLVDKENICFINSDSVEDYESCLTYLMEDKHRKAYIGENARCLTHDINWPGVYEMYMKIVQN